ncbi:hypothetical protein GCM10025734_00980 [Kitasatospora paranensis]
MTDRRPYPSDLSDARWALVEPTLTAWRRARTERALAFGRPPEHELRDLLDAILYVDRTGIPWRYLPHDYPPWETAYAYFARWQKEECSSSSTDFSDAWSAPPKGENRSRRPASSTRRA